MQKVDYVDNYAEGYLAHGTNNNGAKTSTPLVDMRAAIIPPASNHDGYFLILGQKYESSVKGKGPLLYLTEVSHSKIGDLLRKLSDDVSRMKVSKLYVDMGRKGFFHKVHDHFQCTGVSVCRAPFVEDLDYGLTLINEWLSEEAIDIPDVRFGETIIRAQLESTTFENVGYAVDAMRFIVGGFEKEKPYRSAPVLPDRPWIYD